MIPKGGSERLIGPAVCQDLSRIVKKLKSKIKQTVRQRRMTVSKRNQRLRSVLILECDPISLSTMHGNIGKSFKTAIEIACAALNATWSRNEAPDIEFIHVTSIEVLLARFRKLADAARTFDVVIIIGHSRSDGLVLVPGSLTPWSGVAEWLWPIQPQSIVLVACEAASWLPSVTLFDRITDLQVIWGSPIKMSVPHAFPLLALSAALVVEPYLTRKTIAVVNQALSVLSIIQLGTGGVITYQTRKDYQMSKPIDTLERIGTEYFLQCFQDILRDLRR